MRKPSAAQILLVVAAFLAPILGGQLNTEISTLEPGFGAFLRSIFKGQDIPTLSHALVALLTVLSLCVVIVRRKVFQIPVLRVGGAVLLGFGWLAVSLAFSQFFSVSLTILLEWLTYGIAFFAVVACVGRRRGPEIFIAAMVAGCTVLAVLGIREYMATGPADPTWRVFSLWTPNSLAGILGMGLSLALGYAIYLNGGIAAAPWSAAVVIAISLLMTQSRAGVAAAFIGLLTLGAFAVFWQAGRLEKIQAALKIVSCLVVALVFVRFSVWLVSRPPKIASAQPSSAFRLVQDAPAAPTASPFGRMSVQADQQSGQFRVQLWKGAIKSITSNPIGTGIGTYRFFSAQSGLTTQTHLAHETYLQLGVEAGILGLVMLPAIVILWLREMLRGTYRKLGAINWVRVCLFTVAVSLLLVAVRQFGPNLITVICVGGAFLYWRTIECYRGPAKVTRDQNILKAAIIGAIGSSVADNLIESGLYSFGIGWCFFALLGLGMLLAVDGVAPEVVPKSFRWTGFGIAALVGLGISYCGVVEAYRSRGRFERDRSRDYPQALRFAQWAISLNGADGESLRLAASVTPSATERKRFLEEAARLHPNARNLRAYGIQRLEANDPGMAAVYFEKSLELDPNNLLTLSRLAEAYQLIPNEPKAIETAERIVAIEAKPYFQVRSLPDIVPIETYAAHAFLATKTADVGKRISELEQAMAGYQIYLAKTVPLLRQMAAADPTVGEDTQFGGESFAIARFKMGQAAAAAGFLADTYKALKRSQDEARARTIERDFLEVVNAPRIGSQT